MAGGLLRVWILDEGLPEAADVVRRELEARGATAVSAPHGAGLLVWLRPGQPPATGIPPRPPGIGVWVITENAEFTDWSDLDVDIVHVWPTDRRRVERGVRAMLRRLGVARHMGYAWDLFEVAPTFNGVVEMAPSGPVLSVRNRALVALFANQPAEVIEAELAAYAPLLSEAAATGTPVEQLRDRDSAMVGPIRELVRAVPTAPSDSGNPQVALMINSLTEQMRAEARLAASEARLRDVVNLAGDAILAVRSDGGIRLANRAACRLFGREFDALVDVPAVSVLPGLNDTNLSPRRIWAIRGDEQVPVRLTIGDVTEDGSRTVILHDLQDEERLAEQLMLADRLASLGTLAAGVGHEINNPLGFVLANLEFARRSAAGEAATALDEALEGVARIRSIVDDLRALANTTAPEGGPVDLEDVVRRSLRLLNNEIRHRAVLGTRFDRVPRVVGQPARLGQVVTNLVTTALRAIPVGRTGRIDVTIRHSDGEVVLEVRDDGVGIPADVLPRIFEPFYLMRSGGDPGGLGLALLHGIISSVGGRVEVESQVGSGTRFQVFIPVFAGAVAAPTPGVAEAPLPALRRVLLVDDEPLIGRAVARMLADSWKVRVARGTNDAMAAIDAGEPFDVCLCDLMMPGDGGANFAAALGTRRPELLVKTGFVTGGAFTDDARAFAATVSDRVLGKPFDRTSLEAFLSMLAAR